jgi:hypothetical protein
VDATEGGLDRRARRERHRRCWHRPRPLSPSGRSAAPALGIRRRSRRFTSIAIAGAVAIVALFAGPFAVLTGTAEASSALPCDILSQNGTACVAAYSTVRALYSSYDGPLYQVQRASDNATANIGLQSTGGYVNAAAQDTFCSTTTCTITELFDQSPRGNNLTVEGSGANGPSDVGADANALPINVNGKEAYGVAMQPGVGYRDNNTKGVPTGAAAQGIYAVVSGTNVDDQCCSDFGNVETGSNDTGAGHMDALNVSLLCSNAPCSGNGPWVEADLENGVFQGSGSNTNDRSVPDPFVTAMLNNNGANTFELEGGNATSGSLTTYYDGALPSGYSMNQEGAIALGTGGDNTNHGAGSFFEGVITTGFPSSAADAAVQASIVSAGYSGVTNPLSNPEPSASGPSVVHWTGAAGNGQFGYSSVFTVDSSNGDLQETYLPYMGGAWITHNLSTGYGAPPVKSGTQPVAVVHCGQTSVFTVDTNGDLQDTYLNAIGDPWSTVNLSTSYGTPPTNVTPSALVHLAGSTGAAATCGWTSVYTVDASNEDLQETSLPAGGSWGTQNLSANYGTPGILSGTSPVSVSHCGWTSVYTVDTNNQLQETYLPSIGDPWSTQSLSAKYGTPLTATTPTAVVHFAGATGGAAGCGWTSVYTVDQSTSHLQETSLPAIGIPWGTQDLSAKFGTPPVAAGTEPVAIYHPDYHDAWTSVYTVDSSSRQLQETYLPAIGASWGTQSLSANYGTPSTSQTPTVLLHPDAPGNLVWTSVYTVDASNSDLQETSLPGVGQPWATQNLSSIAGTPPAT